MPSPSPVHPSTSGWRFWIDRGGTFTDLVARRPDGQLVTHKLLSVNPTRYADAAIQGIRELMGIAAGKRLPTAAIAEVKMGTTVATNALLERAGEPTVLLTNQGLGDALTIGYQNRPDLFALKIERPPPLHTRVIEIDARLDAEGREEKPVDPAAVRTQLQSAYEAGFRAVAILLMHSYRFPAHEQTVAALAREVGFPQISASHAVSPLIKFVSRGDTTVVDAYLTPLLRRYVAQVSEALAADDDGPRLFFMKSSGGLTAAHQFQGKDAILSGPAGGIVGAARTSQLAGCDEIITFDMGGTSTDVAYYGGQYERRYETEVAGVRLRAPMMDIHTVAAGGGSILHLDGGRMQVGPQSAGAHPGPACYRNGGPLTVTDANVMVGKLQPAYFPTIFGPQGDQPLDDAVVRAQFTALAAEMGPDHTPESVADGCLRIAVETMAQAVKKISVQQGRDVTRCVLNCFGGAGAQHACALADALGMEEVLLHPLGGVLSAYGMGLAAQRATREGALGIPLNESADAKITRLAETLQKSARAELIEAGVVAADLTYEVTLHCRYEGTDCVLFVAGGEVETVAQAFAAQHQERFGFISPEKAIIVEAVAIEAIGAGYPLEEATMPVHEDVPLTPLAQTQFYAHGVWQDANVFRRESLAAGDLIPGPAIILEPHATIIVEAGWQATMNRFGHLRLQRVAARTRDEPTETACDPIRLEIFHHRFMSIAEEMGAALASTASSVNIKERLDFSCALFDAAGDLVANAPHVPVHLGSMGASVKSVMTRHAATMQAGDVFVLNHPYEGGTHLPDITTVMPVYAATGSPTPLFYVAARGHHADVGGKTPGSMPPDSTRLDEEGVLLDNLPLVLAGAFQEATMVEALSAPPYPARNLAQNLADLKAQAAACAKGARELTRMVTEFGLPAVRAYMRHIQDHAEAQVRAALKTLPAATHVYPLDDGGQIALRLCVDSVTGDATLDFTGTSPQQAHNRNAPTCITQAAILYVVRCLVPEAIPLNEGCLKPLQLIVPSGTLLSPVAPAAVCAGNVETSQAVTETLLATMDLLAESQATMNSLTFGNGTHQYYETICGGTGAGPGFAGADAIHSHMTNTRITDPEILESRFPVVLERFAIRQGSGGHGQWRGGDGAERVIRFREPMTAAILSSRRDIPPAGRAGGSDGAKGLNQVRRDNGATETLPGMVHITLQPGDTLCIHTPGGGGWGKKTKRPA